MIAGLVDKIVGVFSPERALQRQRSREVQRRYDAARKDRTTSNWRPSNHSADLEALSDADVIRARARDLVRNNAYAKGIVRAKVRNIVGCGIRPQVAVTRRNGKPNERFNQRAEQVFERWQRRCDVSGRLSFYEMQRLIRSELTEAGECLVNFVRSSDRSRPVPLALELIEADRLASDVYMAGYINPDNGNEVRRGVELDKTTGAPVAYWIYERHPNDVLTRTHRPVRRSAGTILHLYKQERIGQTRGVSEFAPVVRWLKDLHYYVENEMVSSAIASCFSVAIKTMGAGADGGLLDSIDSDADDTDGNRFEYLQPGQVARLFPTEDIEVINPNRQNASANEWINLMLRSMGVGVGLSYERLVRDYSQTNYSSNRASDLEDRREFRIEQQWLIDNLCYPVWLRFMTAAVSSGVDGFPTEQQFVSSFDDWMSVRWQPPGWEWVDPVKEQKAAADAVASNLSTMAEELGKRGKDWREVMEQRAIEKQYALELGLSDAEASETAPAA